MKKIIKLNLSFIICIFLDSIVLSFSKKEETADPANSSSSSSSTNTISTCSAGNGAGAGPAVGDINLEKATYLANCFSSYIYQIEFKDNTLSILTSYISSLKDIKRSHIDQLLKDAEKDLLDEKIYDQKKFLINQKIDVLKSIIVN